MPDTLHDLCAAIDKLESRSSVLTRIKHDLRKQIVRALINRRPPTLRETFDEFKLDDHGVSYTAFYYWARKIRRFAALFEMNHTLEDKDDPSVLLPRILASRMLDNALDDAVDVGLLRKLMDTYRMACAIETTRNRLDLQRLRLESQRNLDQAAGNKDILRVARLIARTQQQFNREDAARGKDAAAAPAQSTSPDTAG